MSNQLLFFLSALGAFNGLLLSLYLFLAKPRTLQRQILASLLLMTSLRISKSVWFYFDPNVGKQFLQLGLSACFLIGPLTYFYVNCAVNKLENLAFNWRWHLSLLLIVIVFVGSLYPYQSNTELWGTFYAIINWSWAFYLVLSANVLYPFVKSYLKGTEKLNREVKLCYQVFVGISIIWFAYYTASYTSYIVGALSFTFILYISALIWVFPKFANAATEKSKQTYVKKIPTIIAEDTERKLFQLMEEEQLFKDANLSLPKLAKRLSISVPQLSQYLNDNLQKSFATYINEMRIAEAKKILLANRRMTMEQVAELSGYNSQSTFYTSFKQIENCTPAKYRNQQLDGSKETSEL